MSTPPSSRVPGSSPGPARRSRIVPDLLAGFGVTAGLAGVLGAVLGLPAVYALKVLGVYALLGILILAGRPPTVGPGLGWPNRITLSRAVLALPLAGLALSPALSAGEWRWWAVGLGTVALLMDGLDGWLARRTGTETRFGARFDMETDAALILVLSILVWSSGQAPAWVLGMGALRYLFVAAGWFQPRLRGELPPSFRRKVVCVVQGVALLVCLAPLLPPGPATVLAGVALALLVWSFAVDTAWLWRHGPRRAVTSRLLGGQEQLEVRP